ncbi:MAG: biopolymer transporter ExbD [Candidatus Eremiobacteraeota bacterium]|nr:biopolymer transporter ExbD [Candidatus Eremiobacteraeota bacterium]
MSVIGSQPEEDVMSTINITPFTDVLLVLLIIFMILTSLLKPPPVPEAKNKIKVTNSTIVMIISHNQKTNQDEIQVGADTIPKTELYNFMEGYYQQFGKQDDIIIKAAPAVKYGTVLTVMDAAKRAGFTQFGLANKIQGATQDVNNP